MFLVKKDFVSNHVEYVEQIDMKGSPIDYFVPEQYTIEQLEKLL